jgi:hypothetical protein
LGLHQAHSTFSDWFAAIPVSRLTEGCGRQSQPFHSNIPSSSVSANVGPNIRFAKRLERALKIARGEPLIIDGTMERITPDVGY